ncbi:IclR family transcriptional regulator [Nocardioides korecus]
MPRDSEITPATSGPSAGPARPGGVQSLHRALDVLETVASRGGTLTLGEIAETTGVPLPTVHRLLRTLVERGYMRQTPDRRYALGFRLAPLAASAGSMVGAGTERELTSLVDALGETANLAVLDGDRVVYVAQVPGRHSMRMFTEVGRRVHPHCTAVGKAMLAHAGDDDVRVLLRRTGLPRHTDHTLTDPEEFLARLAVVREQGYALDEGEQEVGVRCVAVAPTGTAVPIAVSVSGPAPRMTDDLVARAVPLLRAAAARLVADLT